MKELSLIIVDLIESEAKKDKEKYVAVMRAALIESINQNEIDPHKRTTIPAPPYKGNNDYKFNIKN